MLNDDEIVVVIFESFLFFLFLVIAAVVLQAQNDHLRNDGLIPQLFTSVPAFNEAASYLSQTTSLFTQCFTDSSGTLPCSVF